MRVASPGGGSPVDVPNLLATTLERSRERCLQLYAPEGLGDFRRAMVRLGLKPTQQQLPLAHGEEGGDGGQGASVALAGKRAREASGEEAGADGDDADAATNEAAAAAGGAVPLSPRSRAFAGLFEWRDATARAEDESIHFVLPNRLLVRLATERPATVDALSRACHPMPPLIRTRMADVVRAITTGGDGAAAAAAAVPPAARHAGFQSAAAARAVLTYVAPSSAHATAAAALPSSLLLAAAQSSAAAAAAASTATSAAPPQGGWLAAPSAASAPRIAAAAPRLTVFEDGDSSDTSDAMEGGGYTEAASLQGAPGSGAASAAGSGASAAALARGIWSALGSESWHAFMSVPLPQPRVAAAAQAPDAAAPRTGSAPSAALALLVLEAAVGLSGGGAPPPGVMMGVTLPVHPDLLARARGETVATGAAAAAAVPLADLGGNAGDLATSGAALGRLTELQGGTADGTVGSSSSDAGQQPQPIRSLAERFPRAKHALERRAVPSDAGAPAPAAAVAEPLTPFDYGAAPADTTGTRAALLAAAVSAGPEARGPGARGGHKASPGGGRVGGGRGKANPYMHAGGAGSGSAAAGGR